MRRTVAAPMSSISASPGYFARHRGDRIAFNLFIPYICFLARQIESINGASVVTRGEPSPRQTGQTREKRYDTPELSSEERRGGNESASTCRSRWSSLHENKKEVSQPVICLTRNTTPTHKKSL